MAHENPLVGHTEISGMIGNDYPENRFPGPNGEEYFLQIDPKTGATTVWIEEFGADKNVGTYDKDGNFVPNKNLWGGARKEEKEYFNSDKGRMAVKNQSKTVMQNSGGRVNGSDEVLNSRRQHEITSEIDARTTNNEQLAQDNALKKEAIRNENLANMGGTAIGRENYGVYCYPITLRRGQQDRLKISVLKFKPKAMKGMGFADRNERIVSGGTRTSIGGPTSSDFERVGQGRTGFLGRTAIGSVVLPVNNLKDNNKTDWGDSKMNAGQIAAANIALSTLEEGVAEGLGIAGNVLDQAGEPMKDALKQFFVGQATGVKGILARTAGAAINPNMELIFKGPQLRSFGFTYRLSARENKETAEIKKIIRMFKQSMAPQTTEQNLFLKAPNTYRLEYLTAGQGRSHSYLPKIKECALLGFDVNYTPDGSYMTYEDSSMVAYEITFSFQELDPIYNADYTNLDGDSDSSIGY